jgi:hypothetical protein
MARTCGSDRNSVSFKSSSRSLPLKLSMNALWVGLQLRDATRPYLVSHNVIMVRRRTLMSRSSARHFARRRLIM